MIQRYDTFFITGCRDEVSFGYFNDQIIPSNYYDFLNDDDSDDGNNITVTSVDNSLPDNKVLEYAAMTNDKYINSEIIIDDDESLSSDIVPLQK